MIKCPFCKLKNTSTSIIKPYKTYCLNCKKEIPIKSETVDILESMEDWKY